MTANIGNVHHYLCMTFDYSRSGCVSITMFDYIQQILNELDPTHHNFRGTALTPTTTNIFCNDNIDTEALSKEEAKEFHSHVAKLLFILKRARPDTQTAVAYLCTRVQLPNIYDKRKLGRVMRYLQGTKFYPSSLDGTALVECIGT